MGLFWSGATPVFSSVSCPMTRLLKTVTHAQTLLKLQKFPLTGKVLKLQIFPPAGNSGRMDRKTAAVSTRYRRRALCAGPMPFHAGKRKTRIRCLRQTDSDFSILVRVVGVEPTRLAAREPKSRMSANSIIPAWDGGRTRRRANLRSALPYTIRPALSSRPGRYLPR